MIKLSPREKSTLELAETYKTFLPKNLPQDVLASQLNINPVILKHLESGVVGKRNRLLMFKVFDHLDIPHDERERVVNLILSVTEPAH